jgi:preprotein translocase subunit SecE
MKAINNICRFGATIFGLASLVLFFTNFVNITVDGAAGALLGVQASFGSEVEIGGIAYDMAKSAHMLLCFWISVIGVVLSALSFKSKKVRVAVPIISLIAAVYMLVMRLSSPYKFIDFRPISLNAIGEMNYTLNVTLLVIALFVLFALSLAYLLVDDYIEVLASKGEKRTLFRRVIQFFRDYKSEVKKIVWPGLKDVVKNTVIVLIMCLLLGVIIWGVDIGLGALLDWILGV